MSDPRYMNNRVQDLGNNVVSVECPIEYTDGYHVTCGWSEDDGAWIAEVSGVSTGSILADGPTRELAVLALVISCCATIDAVTDSATVAALTAENERLRGLLADSDPACTADCGYPSLCYMYPNERHVGCPRQGAADPTPAAPDQAEGPEENRGADVSRVTSRAEESVMDKGVFRYDTDKTRLGAPPVPWDPSHREIL